MAKKDDMAEEMMDKKDTWRKVVGRDAPLHPPITNNDDGIPEMDAREEKKDAAQLKGETNGW
jgi:hypothetical protein